MSIVNTCYTKQLQELEFAEKLNKQEVDRMYEAYMNCLNQNKNLNSKIKILQEKNKKEVFSIKYLPMFPSGVNDLIRQHLQNMKYRKIRTVVWRYILIGLEKQFVNKYIYEIEVNFCYTFNNLRKNRTPELTQLSNRLEEMFSAEDNIEKLKTYKEKTNWLCNHTQFNLHKKLNYVFTYLDFKKICFGDNDLYSRRSDYYRDIVEEIYDNSLREVIQFYLTYDKWLINKTLSKIIEHSRLINEIWSKCKTNFDEGVYNKVANEEKAEYKLLCSYNQDMNWVKSLTEIPAKFTNLLLNNKSIPVVNKSGTSINKNYIRIFMIDLAIYLKTMTDKNLKYLYVRIHNIYKDSDKTVFRYFKNDLCWYIKNIVMVSGMTETENKLQLIKDIYNSIPVFSRTKELKDYDSLDKYDLNRKVGKFIEPTYINLTEFGSEDTFESIKNGEFIYGNYEAGDTRLSDNWFTGWF